MNTFRINDKNRNGLLFVSTTGADLFLVWNDTTNTALISNAKTNPCGISTTQLPVSTLKNLKSKLSQLVSRGYTIYTTSGGISEKGFIDIDSLKDIQSLTK